jgi:hypothetical protein
MQGAESPNTTYRGYRSQVHTPIIKFKKDSHELTTHIEKRDADECMDGIKCVYLGIQVAQFIKNFEEEK